MVKLNENFVVDKCGERLGVFLDMKSYRKVLDALEELDDIRAYDEAKTAGGGVVSFKTAVKEIEQGRRKCATR